MRIVVESEAKEGSVLDEEWGMRRQIHFVGRGHMVLISFFFFSYGFLLPSRAVCPHCIHAFSSFQEEKKMTETVFVASKAGNPHHCGVALSAPSQTGGLSFATLKSPTHGTSHK